jgi:hypothetical protein
MDKLFSEIVRDKELRSRIVRAAQEASVAVATFWDSLRVAEAEYGVEFDGTLNVIDALASSTDVPPEPLSEENVLGILDTLQVS